jgi:hypothetical protein
LKKIETVNKEEEIPILRAPTGKKPNFMIKKPEKPKYPSYINSKQDLNP